MVRVILNLFEVGTFAIFLIRINWRWRWAWHRRNKEFVISFKFTDKSIIKIFEEKELCVEGNFETHGRLVKFDVIHPKLGSTRNIRSEFELVSPNNLFSVRKRIVKSRIFAVSEELSLVVHHQLYLHHVQQFLLRLKELCAVKSVVCLPIRCDCNVF